MIDFDHNHTMKRYDVKVPFALAGIQDMVTVASISEDKEKRVTLHRDISLRLLKQIILKWDEKEYQMSREEAESWNFKYKTKEKGNK